MLNFSSDDIDQQRSDQQQIILSKAAFSFYLSTNKYFNSIKIVTVIV